jgi:hypothetical protein
LQPCARHYPCWRGASLAKIIAECDVELVAEALGSNAIPLWSKPVATQALAALADAPNPTAISQQTEDLTALYPGLTVSAIAAFSHTSSRTLKAILSASGGGRNTTALTRCSLGWGMEIIAETFAAGGIISYAQRTTGGPVAMTTEQAVSRPRSARNPSPRASTQGAGANPLAQAFWARRGRWMKTRQPRPSSINSELVKKRPNAPSPKTACLTVSSLRSPKPGRSNMIGQTGNATTRTEYDQNKAAGIKLWVKTTSTVTTYTLISQTL